MVGSTHMYEEQAGVAKGPSGGLLRRNPLLSCPERQHSGQKRKMLTFKMPNAAMAVPANIAAVAQRLKARLNLPFIQHGLHSCRHCSGSLRLQIIERTGKRPKLSCPCRRPLLAHSHRARWCGQYRPAPARQKPGHRSVCQTPKRRSPRCPLP